MPLSRRLRLFGQRFGSGGGDVAADHLNLGEVLFDPANAVDDAWEWPWAVSTMITSTPASASAATRSGVSGPVPTLRYQQAAVAIFSGHRVGTGFFDVLESHQAAQMEGVIDNQHFLNAVFAHLGFASFKVGAFFHCYQPLAGSHNVGNAVAVSWKRMSRSVTMSPGFSFYHWEAGEAVFAGHGQQVFQLGFGANGDRVFDNDAFVLLHLAHFSGRCAMVMFLWMMPMPPS